MGIKRHRYSSAAGARAVRSAMATGPPPPSSAITHLVQKLSKCFVDTHRL
eukprot:COSAG06_NODE_47410_length_339_cov_0.866667_2_plen_49_part_01